MVDDTGRVDAEVTLHVPCARGTELCVEHELKGLGAVTTRAGKAVVTATGSIDLVPLMNVFSRCGHRVLLERERFVDVTDADDLMERLARVPFEHWLDEKGTFAVHAHLTQCAWTHEHYAALKVKDAVVDRLRALGRGRPNVDTRDPNVWLVLHWERNVATLSLDTSGEPLHRRGYRRGVTGAAPMRETLAASILAMGHADVARPFLDPCCGTGTLAIEQALRVLRRAPGVDKKPGYLRWRFRTQQLDRAHAKAVQRARDEELPALPVPVELSDWHKDAIDDAERCIAQAGLERHLRPVRRDARAAPMPGERPVVCTNLPFGERLAKNRLQLEGFYRTLAGHLRDASTTGSRVLLFSAHDSAARLLADLDSVARTKRRWSLRSGDLQAQLFRWDLPALRGDSPLPANASTTDDDQQQQQGEHDDDHPG